MRTRGEKGAGKEKKKPYQIGASACAATTLRGMKNQVDAQLRKKALGVVVSYVANPVLYIHKITHRLSDHLALEYRVCHIAICGFPIISK